MGSAPSSQPGRLLILGAGGHAKVAADCATAMQAWSEIILFDDRWPTLKRASLWPVAGTFSDILPTAQPGDQVFAAVGDGALRLSWLEKFAALRNPDVATATLIHPRSTIACDVEIGAGTLIAAGAVINVSTRIGRGVIVNTSASVDHDCDLADGVHICPGAHLGGTVKVGRLAWIGIGSSVRHSLTIGERTTVAAGAAVVTDLAAGITAAGVPARQIQPAS